MNLVKSLKNFLQNSRHIVNISYKPSQAEFKKSAKLIIIGILLIGVLGFVIAVIISLIVTGNLSLA
jgi:protein translocase SEC61 complex gamma subunit